MVWLRREEVRRELDRFEFDNGISRIGIEVRELIDDVKILMVFVATKQNKKESVDTCGKEFERNKLTIAE